MTPTQYRAELSKLEFGHYLDWNSPAEHVYQKDIGELKLQLRVNPKGRTAWEIRRGAGPWEVCTPMNSGDSEDATVAMRECLMYANDVVKRVLTPTPVGQ